MNDLFPDLQQQLNKLSVYKKPMQFQITDIEFDFDDDLDPISKDEMDDIYDDTLSTTWDADDEDDLIEEITCATGWCIKSIDYREVLK